MKQLIFSHRFFCLLLILVVTAINASPNFAVNTKQATSNIKDAKAKHRIAKWEKKIKKWTAREGDFFETKKPQPWLALGLGIIGSLTILLAIYAAFGSAALATALLLIAALGIGVLGWLFGINSFKRRKETQHPGWTGIISALGMILCGAIVVVTLFSFANAIFN